MSTFNCTSNENKWEWSHCSIAVILTKQMGYVQHGLFPLLDTIQNQLKQILTLHHKKFITCWNQCRKLSSFSKPTNKKKSLLRFSCLFVLLAINRQTRIPWSAFRFPSDSLFSLNTLCTWLNQVVQLAVSPNLPGGTFVIRRTKHYNVCPVLSVHCFVNAFDFFRRSITLQKKIGCHSLF